MCERKDWVCWDWENENRGRVWRYKEVDKRNPLFYSFKINPLVLHSPGTRMHCKKRENTHRTWRSSQKRLCIPELFPWLPSIDNRLRGLWEKRAFVSHPRPANDSGWSGLDDCVTPQGPLQGEMWRSRDLEFFHAGRLAYSMLVICQLKSFWGGNWM